MRPTVETFTGKIVDFTNPDPATICLADIAVSLSRQNRYNGHSRDCWNVASHSMLCHDFALTFFPEEMTPALELHILLHDAHEAYTGDIVAPLKCIPEIHAVLKPIEQLLQRAIEQAFRLDPVTADEAMFIKMLDEKALAIEAHHLMPSKGKDWSLSKVFMQALDLFDEADDEHTAYSRFMFRVEHRLKQISDSTEDAA